MCNFLLYDPIVLQMRVSKMNASAIKYRPVREAGCSHPSPLDPENMDMDPFLMFCEIEIILFKLHVDGVLTTSLLIKN